MPTPLRPVTVRYARSGSYDVRFGELASIAEHARAAGLAARAGLVVTDTNVERLYLATVRDALAAAGWKMHTLAVPPGEASKGLGSLTALYDAAVAAGLDRGDAVFALGGGVVGDLAGYAAATWLRGLPLVQLPTTLLAQCDSAIGGKTGINYAGAKNQVGATWPPRLVLTDISTLDTLPDAVYREGLAEVVKHALLSGPAAVAELDAAWEGISAREPAVVGPVVHRAAAFKAEVVSEDELEAGRRAFLNLGHTFAHAIEAAGGDHSHGQAVALGLRAALHLSASLAAGRALPATGALPSPFDAADALVGRLDAGPRLDADPTALDAALRRDKKRAAGDVRFVVLAADGSPRLAGDVPPAMVAAAWERARRAGA